MIFARTTRKVAFWAKEGAGFYHSIELPTDTLVTIKHFSHDGRLAINVEPVDNVGLYRPQVENVFRVVSPLEILAGAAELGES